MIGFRRATVGAQRLGARRIVPCLDSLPVPADADIASVASLLADGTRASILIELTDGRALPPSELASRARVSRATVSEHLGKLLDAGLVAVERGGRNRYYRLAGAEVAYAIEAVAAIAPARPARSLREANRGEAIRAARTCYGHLAGALGVALADALIVQDLMVREDERFELTPAGGERFERLGVRPRPGKPCNDWSERRPHLAGPLGVALTTRLFELGWLERPGTSRAVLATAAGTRGLERELGVSIPAGAASSSR